MLTILLTVLHLSAPPDASLSAFQVPLASGVVDTLFVFDEQSLAYDALAATLEPHIPLPSLCPSPSSAPLPGLDRVSWCRIVSPDLPLLSSTPYPDLPHAFHLESGSFVGSRSSHPVSSSLHLAAVDHLPHSATQLDLRRFLVGAGAHRSLVTSWTLQGELPPQCTLSLVDTLPTALFADPFELSELQRLGDDDTVRQISEPVDLEQPSWLAQQHTLTATAPASYDNVTVPLHTRYMPLRTPQTPNTESFIGPPLALLHCPSHSSPQVVSLTSPAATKLTLPAGTVAHAPLVLWGTSIFAWCSALFLVYEMLPS